MHRRRHGRRHHLGKVLSSLKEDNLSLIHIFDGRRARYTHEMPVDAYTGDAILLKIDIEPWGLITDKHLDAACEKYGVDKASLKGKVLLSLIHISPGWPWGCARAMCSAP